MIPGILSPPPLLRDTGASYRGGQFNFGTSNALSTMGAAAGDLLVIHDPGGSGTVSLSNGAALTETSGFRYRVLAGGDLTATVTCSASGGSALIYRGAASIALVDTSSGTGSVDAGGFTKNGSHAGIIAIIISSTAAATLAVNSPPTFATRANQAASPLAAQTLFICDRLQPVNPVYVNSASILWSCSAAASLSVLELRT